MYVRSLLVSGATAEAQASWAQASWAQASWTPASGTPASESRAAGSRGLAAATDTSSTSDHYLYLQDYYYEQYRIDYQNYLDACDAAGGQPAADYYYKQYQDDYSIYLFYTSKLIA